MCNLYRYRENYEGLVEKLHVWVREAEAKLEAGKHGVDFGNITQDLEDHKVRQQHMQ